jgi:hypothetical protein
MTTYKRDRDGMAACRKLMILIFGFLIIPLHAQDNGQNSMVQFLFPEFVSCQVKMKTGNVNNLTANYNTISEKLVLMKDSVPQDMVMTSFIDTIIMSGRQFVPFKDVLYEVLVDAPVSLFLQHKKKLIDAGQPAAYGGRSQTTAVDRVSMIQSNSNFYNLSIPEEYQVVDSHVFWVRKDNQLYSFLSKRQLIKIFPEKSDEIDEFISRNRLKIDDRDDMIRLIQFYNSL